MSEYTKTHLWYLALIAIMVLAGHSWLAEHDARVLAEQTIKVNEQKVADYQKQIDGLAADRDSQIAKIEKKVAAVKTPAQAIAAIPDVSTLPLHVAPVPTAPEAVQVDALALYQTLATCQVDRVKLDTCSQAASLKDAQIVDLQSTVTTLRKPKGVWKRIFGTLKVLGIGIAIGGALVGMHL